LWSFAGSEGNASLPLAPSNERVLKERQYGDFLKKKWRAGDSRAPFFFTD
jgi:hypothetical protein